MDVPWAIQANLISLTTRQAEINGSKSNSKLTCVVLWPQPDFISGFLQIPSMLSFLIFLASFTKCGSQLNSRAWLFSQWPPTLSRPATLMATVFPCCHAYGVSSRIYHLFLENMSTIITMYRYNGYHADIICVPVDRSTGGRSTGRSNYEIFRNSRVAVWHVLYILL